MAKAKAKAKGAIPSEEVGSDHYDLDAVQAELGNLCRLLDVTVDRVTNMDYGVGENRNHELDRVAALIQVACDCANRLDRQIALNFDRLRGRSPA